MRQVDDDAEQAHPKQLYKFQISISLLRMIMDVLTFPLSSTSLMNL